MKRLAFAFLAILALGSSAEAGPNCTQYKRRCDTAATIDFNLFQYDSDGTNDNERLSLKTDATCANTVAANDNDIRLMLDEGNYADATNCFTDEGTGYSLVITQAEMSAHARIHGEVVDLTSPAAWVAWCFDIESVGNCSGAQHGLPDVNVVDIDSSVSLSATEKRKW